MFSDLLFNVACVLVAVAGGLFLVHLGELRERSRLSVMRRAFRSERRASRVDAGGARSATVAGRATVTAPAPPASSAAHGDEGGGPSLHVVGGDW